MRALREERDIGAGRKEFPVNGLSKNDRSSERDLPRETGVVEVGCGGLSVS